MAHCEEYLEHVGRERKPETVGAYRAALRAFCEFLDGRELTSPQQLDDFANRLAADGYSASTVNKFVAIVNGAFGYFGRHDLQLTRRNRPESERAPELTRAEYLRLLGAAKQLDDRRGYLLVKLLAAMELPANFVEEVTVEAAKAGLLIFTEDGGARLERFPGGMAQELQEFAQEQGIASGAVFRARDGGAMKRENVHYVLQRLCRAAQVDVRKGNVKALRRLRESTRRELESQINVEALVRQMWERVLEGEEGTVGW